MTVAKKKTTKKRTVVSRQSTQPQQELPDLIRPETEGKITLYITLAALLLPLVVNIAGVMVNPHGWASRTFGFPYFYALIFIYNPVGLLVALLLFIGLCKKGVMVATSLVLLIISVIYSIFIFQVMSVASTNEQEFTG